MIECKRAARRLAAVAVLGVLAAVAPPARGQGFFYAEVERDGRIYVFNQMKAYQAFEKSGEVGAGITRIGAGPSGETVVFDSEEAIQLYNFKHDRAPEAVAKKEERKPVQKFSWKSGKTTWETDSAALTLSNRVQVRHTVEDPENGDTKGSFRIRRAKTKLSGWMYSKSFEYELQLNWADRANVLEDAVLSFDATGGRDRFTIKAGQFKVPFGRQELTSSGSQQFVDRSIVSNEFAKGRDIGVQVGGTAAGKVVDWRLGAFNGAGRTVTANDNTEYQYNGRLMVQPWGDVKYSESDFESQDRPLVALGVNFEVNDLRGVDPDVNERKRTIVGFDGALKYRGFSAVGEYFKRTLDPEEGSEFDSDGFHVQGGMFLYRRAFEVAGRYGSWDPSDAVADNDRNEYGIALNYFHDKHAMKLQGDYRWIEDERTSVTNRELRVQLQFLF